jgi:hypothetical protein
MAWGCYANGDLLLATASNTKGIFFLPSIRHNSSGQRHIPAEQLFKSQHWSDILQSTWRNLQHNAIHSMD